MNRNIKIDGLLDVTTSHDEFLEEFYIWLEGKNWTFFGHTKELTEDELEILE